MALGEGETREQSYNLSLIRHVECGNLVQLGEWDDSVLAELMCVVITMDDECGGHQQLSINKSR